MTPDNIKNGFRKCGIHPYNPNAIDRSQLFRNHLIADENVDLSISPVEAPANVELAREAPATPDATIEIVNNELPDIELPDADAQPAATVELPNTEMPDVAVKHTAAVLGERLGEVGRDESTDDLLDFEFIAEASLEHSDIMIDLSDVTDIRVEPVENHPIIKIETGRSNDPPPRNFPPGESIELAVMDLVCTC